MFCHKHFLKKIVINLLKCLNLKSKQKKLLVFSKEQVKYLYIQVMLLTLNIKKHSSTIYWESLKWIVLQLLISQMNDLFYSYQDLITFTKYGWPHFQKINSKQSIQQSMKFYLLIKWQIGSNKEIQTLSILI